MGNWCSSPSPQPPPVVGVETPLSGVVTRREIREMDAVAQDRVCDALEAMMSSGEYFRLASYHGWPGDYCAHGMEHFPAWHRAYLVDFERALRRADMSLGGDGNIGLPYWDSARVRVGGEVFPAVLRRRFPSLPPALARQVRNHARGAQAMQLVRIGYDVPSDGRIAASIAGLAAQYERALLEDEHWRFASVQSTGVSLEQPHNEGHVALGFPMTSVSFAAFHPIFFMHHANVDRVYEQHLRLEPDSAQEFAATQRRRVEEGTQAVSNFDRQLSPFDFYPREMFDAARLGFAYDRLPGAPARARQLRAPPDLCVFPKVSKKVIDFRSYQMHVFVVPRASAGAGLPPLGVGPDAWAASPHYAGVTAVFGGKGARCVNCQEIQPFNIALDVSEALRRQNLRRSGAKVIAYAVTETGDPVTLHRTGLPAPILTGPVFEAEDGDEAESALDVATAQTLLRSLGYDCAEDPEGVVGMATSQVLRAFQARHGLAVTGRLGPETKRMLNGKRFDLAQDEADDEVPRVADGTPLRRGSRVAYYVGTGPGYYQREKLLSDVAKALDPWAKATGVAFHVVTREADALLKVRFSDRPDGDAYQFDGRGGALARADGWNVVLDAAERWDRRGYSLRAVLLHEVGHVLGLAHHNIGVMRPYYNGKVTSLHAVDVRRVQALYPP